MKGPLHHFDKHVFFTCNLRRKRYTYNVEIDMVVCTMSIPVSLIRLNQIKSNLTFKKIDTYLYIIIFHTSNHRHSNNFKHRETKQSGFVYKLSKIGVATAINE